MFSNYHQAKPERGLDRLKISNIKQIPLRFSYKDILDSRHISQNYQNEPTARGYPSSVKPNKESQITERSSSVSHSRKNSIAGEPLQIDHLIESLDNSENQKSVCETNRSNRPLPSGRASYQSAPNQANNLRGSIDITKPHKKSENKIASRRQSENHEGPIEIDPKILALDHREQILKLGIKPPKKEPITINTELTSKLSPRLDQPNFVTPKFAILENNPHLMNNKSTPILFPLEENFEQENQKENKENNPSLANASNLLPVREKKEFLARERVIPSLESINQKIQKKQVK